MSNPQIQEPYYAVIFTSLRKGEADGYNEMAEHMQKLSTQQEGYLGVQSVRGNDGIGITVSYWRNLEDIARWKSNTEHQEAQKQGKDQWYSGYEVRICRVEREYTFGELPQ